MIRRLRTGDQRGGNPSWCAATLLILLMAMLISACVEDTTTAFPTEPPVAANRVPAGPKVVRIQRLDDAWSRLAREDLPGFAGYYTDSIGQLVILARTPNVRMAAEAYARANLAALGWVPSRVVFRVVKYDADQLSGWHDSLIPLFASGVIMTDFDETQNKLFIGIVAGASVSSLRAQLAQRSIPDDAIIIQEVQQTQPDVTLNDPVRPAVAGLELSGCTLGFNTLLPAGGNQAAFVTASHCSDVPFSALPDSTIFGQPVAFNHPVGYEALDEELHVGQVVFEAANRTFTCNAGCRLSDTLIGLYYDSVPSAQGVIARTLSFSTMASPGSLTINPNDPAFEIFNKLPFNFQTVGLPSSKMGQRTGWTRGAITRTCINRAFPGLSLVICQHQASNFRQPGDSGAPFFFDVYNLPVPANLAVHLMGTHVGPAADNINHSVFSTIQGTEDDFAWILKVCNWANNC